MFQNKAALVLPCGTFPGLRPHNTTCKVAFNCQTRIGLKIAALNKSSQTINPSVGFTLTTCVETTHTPAPGLQVFFHEIFRGGEFTELQLGHVVALSHRAHHLRLLLMAVLSLNMDPRDFPIKHQSRLLNATVSFNQIYGLQVSKFQVTFLDKCILLNPYILH